MPMGRPLLLIITVCFTMLFGCRRGTDPPTLPVTREPVVGAGLAQSLSLVNFAVLLAVPSPLLGPYVTGYLALTGGPPFKSALMAIDAQAALIFRREAQDEEAITLLDHLGSALEVQITDLLDRSPDREKALNEFIGTLRELLSLSRSQLQAFEERMDGLSDDRREKRRRAADIQHALNQALRERNYSLAGSRQEELTEAEKTLAEVEARERHLRNITEIYEDFIEVGDERLNAMEQNRGPLIAGVKVVEVPGIEDIGVIESRRRRPRRSTGGGGNSGSLFDPGPLVQ